MDGKGRLVAALAGLALLSHLWLCGRQAAPVERQGLEVASAITYRRKNEAVLEAIARLTSERDTLLYLTKDASWLAFHVGYARHSAELYPRTVLWAAPVPHVSAEDWHVFLPLEPGPVGDFCRSHGVSALLLDGVDPGTLSPDEPVWRDRGHGLALLLAPRG